MSERKDPQHDETEERKAASEGLEGAAREDSGILREEEVEGADELSIGGGPPSAAGGQPNPRLPTRDDFKRS